MSGAAFCEREAIYTAAVMVILFDCEVLADVRALGMDMRGFGFGTLGLVRMRRRV